MIEYEIKSNSSLEHHFDKYTSYKRPTHILTQRWLYTSAGKYCLDEKCASKFSLVPVSHLSRDEYRLIVSNLSDPVCETNDYKGYRVKKTYHKQYTIPFTHQQHLYTIYCYISHKYTLCKYEDAENSSTFYQIITNEKFTPDFVSLFS